MTYEKIDINELDELRKIGVEISRFPSRKIEWYCNRCKKEVKREDTKCPHCGYEFKEI